MDANQAMKVVSRIPGKKVYIGKGTCGCILAARTAEPFASELDKAQCAEMVGDMILADLVVSQVDAPVVWVGHVCKPPEDCR